MAGAVEAAGKVNGIDNGVTEKLGANLWTLMMEVAGWIFPGGKTFPLLRLSGPGRIGT